MAAPKVELRALAPDDRDRLLGWRNSPDVAAYMYTDHQISPDEHERWFAAIDGDVRRAFWVIDVDGEPAGLANLYDIDRENSRCAWAWYLADPSVRGRGIGGYVQYLVIEKVFGEFGLTELWCEVLESNGRARRLYQKFGFKEKARLRRRALKNGVMEDSLKLGLLADAWMLIRPQMREALAQSGFELP